MPATNAKSEILLIHMSNQVLLFFCGMLLATCALGQQAKIDSLRKIIKSEIKDTAKIIILEELGQAYREEKKIDSSIMALKLALELTKKLIIPNKGNAGKSQHYNICCMLPVIMPNL